MGFQRGASVASGGGSANQAWTSVARKPKVSIPSQLGTITESPRTAGRQVPPVGPQGTAQGPWANAGRTQALRSKIGSEAPSQTSQVRKQLSSMAMSQPVNQARSVWNPSLGTTPTKVSMMSMAHWRTRMTAPSRVGSRVSVPNTNPNVDPTTDDQLAMTIWGPVYSKRRMVIVMWIHERDMFCLPLYTFSGRGINSRGKDIIHEYVALKNAGRPDTNFGKYPAIEVVPKYKDLHKDTTIHITGGLRVGCNEDITRVGKLTKQGYFDLLALWKRLSNDAQQEPWVD
ncbi:hypothetical protein D0868_11433 [Hortaea werneckii]|uniref:Uncharacterized protein n=1 Tax=Hortaea werneckii TaxID=91943 RepID=A0A3M6XZ13_HORWE|nr:hypothetical protein D0868_11433 [Hortaea werneckii]